MHVQQFGCPKCGHVLRTAQSVAVGSRIRCSSCQTVFAVGGKEPRSAAPAAPGVPPPLPKHAAPSTAPKSRSTPAAKPAPAIVRSEATDARGTDRSKRRAVLYLAGGAAVILVVGLGAWFIFAALTKEEPTGPVAGNPAGAGSTEPALPPPWTPPTPPSREPSYRGKAITEWIRLLRDRLGRESAMSVLTKLGPQDGDAAYYLLPLLSDEALQVRLDVAHVLRSIGRPAVPHVLGALRNDPSPIGRGTAAEVLAQMQPKPVEVVPFLLEATKDKEGLVRVQAGNALWQIGQRPEAIQILAEGLKDKDPVVRKHAIFALSNSGSAAKAAIPALIEALKDENPASMAAVLAADMLGKFGPEAKEAVPALVQALESKFPAHVGSAVDALGNIGPEAKAAVPALIKLMHKPAALVVRIESALSRIGTPAVPALIETLNAKEDWVRLHAARALRDMTPPPREAVPALTRLLKNEHSGVQQIAREALKKIDPEAAKRAGVP